LAREERLDVLIHNAAVMTPPAGSKDKLVSGCLNLSIEFVK
jgi:hypothetical protein